MGNGVVNRAGKTRERKPRSRRSRMTNTPAFPLEGTVARSAGTGVG